MAESRAYFTVKTRLMWQNGWFRDYDSVAGEWSMQQDAMHLAPIFCGASSSGTCRTIARDIGTSARS